MIPRQKIDEIFEKAIIEEVIGDFVTLKKKGADYKACCPFHDEKTPSFSVSTSKGIFKCFGCGEGGNVVDFVMKHENMGFIDAVRYLGKKYGVEIEERPLSDEEQNAQDLKESLFIVTEFATQYFEEQLWESDQGKSIALSYLRERGFSDDTIKEFQLGYNPDQWDALTTAALKKGYKLEFLRKTGLSKERNETNYDGYKGRVIFPIHNLTGKTLGFGGRILSNVSKAPKYINSPESEIYDKSNVLYGLYQCKRQISSNDECFLVEGYTDVISLFQNGIKNVVASSGTSLTEGQIRLISRYTKNITILYDGDLAGVKASFRGIDMILKAGLNVKVVLFPDNEDPDSMSKKLNETELKEYIDSNAKDFISFKTGLLKQEIERDPIKKSKLIHEIIKSISLIPDQITRELYLQESSDTLGFPQNVLQSELNKIRRTTVSEEKIKLKKEYDQIQNTFVQAPSDQKDSNEQDVHVVFERDILRILLNYGNLVFELSEDHHVKVYDFIINELEQDQIDFHNNEFSKLYNHLKSVDIDLDLSKLYQCDDEDIRKATIELTSDKYVLSDWEKKNILVQKEEMMLRRTVLESLYTLKTYKIKEMIKNEEELLRSDDLEDEKTHEVLQKLVLLKNLKRKILLEIGRPI